MAKLSQQLHVVHLSQSQSQSIRFDFCGGDHPNGHCTYQHNSPEAEDPSVPKRMSKLEDTMEKLVKAIIGNQENNLTPIRNMEIRMGQIAKQLAERQSG